jgi:hypothetical protein
LFLFEDARPREAAHPEVDRAFVGFFGPTEYSSIVGSDLLAPVAPPLTFGAAAPGLRRIPDDGDAADRQRWDPPMDFVVPFNALLASPGRSALRPASREVRSPLRRLRCRRSLLLEASFEGPGLPAEPVRPRRFYGLDGLIPTVLSESFIRQRPWGSTLRLRGGDHDRAHAPVPRPVVAVQRGLFRVPPTPRSRPKPRTSSYELLSPARPSVHAEARPAGPKDDRSQRRRGSVAPSPKRRSRVEPKLRPPERAGGVPAKIGANADAPEPSAFPREDGGGGVRCEPQGPRRAGVHPEGAERLPGVLTE